MSDLADLNHELSQLMRLHREMRSWRWRVYPKIMRRAGDVAYAAHLRVLLEFFHNGRGGADLNRVGCPKPNDLELTDVDPSATPPSWTDDELRRLCDADKLLGHLSNDRHSRTSDWGRDQDWHLLRLHVDGLLAKNGAGLPEARAARASLP